MTDVRPDPMLALKAAAVQRGVSFTEEFLRKVVELETQATNQNLERPMVQATLRNLIETAAKAET